MPSMTVTAPRPTRTDQGTEALFKEARQRRGRRYWYSGLALVLVVSLGVIAGQRFGGPSKGSTKAPRTAAPKPRPATGPLVPTVGPRQPGPLALGADGKLYVADDALNEILVREPHGTFTVVAGNGKAGYSGDGAAATQAEINRPEGMALAPNGTLYFADSGNSRVRAVLPNGVITTVVGNGLDATGPAGTPVISASPTSTAIGATYAVTIGADGSLYVATSDAVVELAPDGVLSDVVDPENDAGFAPNEPLNSQCEPASVAVDGSGDLYFGCADPYVLVERLPSGELRPLGSDRPHDAAAALVEAPNGDVLAVDGGGVVQYGPMGPQEVVNFLSKRLPGRQDFEPQGIAVSSEGTLYLSQDGIGGIGPPMIVERSPNGKTSVLWSRPAA
jgi:hypothetical protein